MQIRNVLIISFVVVLVFSIPAEGKTLAERFHALDKNNDWQITRDEAKNVRSFDRLLRRFDRNDDGALQWSEVSARRQSSDESSSDLNMPAMPEHTLHQNLRYDEIAGVNPNRLSLDLYVPKGRSPRSGRPVLVMIHGGAWCVGDKENDGVVGAKMRHFVGEGYIFASINYRLSSRRSKTKGIQHPIHVRDCAAAISWVHDNISKYGGDPDSIHLMGHSAGGHLAALVATNEQFLKRQGKDLSIIKTNVILDPGALDVPRYIELNRGRGMTALYDLVFGSEDAKRRDASPQHHVASGKSIPPTLIFYTAGRMNMNVLAKAFAESLTKAGSASRAIDTVTLDHRQINTHIGTIGDPMTELIMRLHAGENASRFASELPSE